MVGYDADVEHGEGNPREDFHGRKIGYNQSATDPRDLQLCQREHTKE